jgi:hypothetical protein
VAALTAVLVRKDGSAAQVVHNQGHGFQIVNDVRALTPASLQPAQASASAAASPTPSAATSAAPTASATPAAGTSPGG